MNHLDPYVRYSPDVCESNSVCLSTVTNLHCLISLLLVLQPVNRKRIQVLHIDSKVLHSLREGRKLPRSQEKLEITIGRYGCIHFLDETPNARMDSSPPSSHIQTSCLNIKNVSPNESAKFIAIKQNPISSTFCSFSHRQSNYIE